MTINELYDAAKLRVRKRISDDLDQDVKNAVNTAIADLKRIGVADSWLDTPEDPLIVEASFHTSRRTIPLTRRPILFYPGFMT